jgi:hypothetical protein
MLPSRTLSRGIAMLALLLALPLQALQSGPGAPAVGEGWTIESLMATLAQQPAGEARFTEIKTLASLKQPLVTEGVLRYRYPDSLEKSAEKPRAERFVIRGDAMEIYRDGKLKRQVLLAGYPALQNFVNSFIATVGGDLEALRKYYELSLEGSRQGWTLLLTPIDAELQRVVKHITVRGKEGVIESFETLQPNDDRSVMLIAPLG